MNLMTRQPRMKLFPLLALVVLAVGGCGGSGDESSVSSATFRDSAMAYVDSMAAGYFGQEDLRRGQLNPVPNPYTRDPDDYSMDPLIRTARSFKQSRRFGSQISSDGLPDEQASFLANLRGLMDEWISINDRALAQAQDGDRPEMKSSLKEADTLKSQIYDLIRTTEIREITDGEVGRKIFDVFIAGIG